MTDRYHYKKCSGQLEMKDQAEDLGIEFNHKITMSHQRDDKAQCDTSPWHKQSISNRNWDVLILLYKITVNLRQYSVLCCVQR